MGPKGQVGNVISKEDAQGYSHWSAGGFVGFDYAFSEVGIGLLTEYERMDAHVGKDWGKFTIDHLHADAYATYAPSQLPEIAINGILGGGYDWYSIHREVHTGTPTTEKGSPRGAELDSLLGIEYTFRDSVFTAMPKSLEIIPLASVEYMYIHIADYKEKGSKLNALKVERQNVKSLRSTLGFRVNYTWKTQNVEISPEANFGWQREFLDKERSVDFTPISFTEFPFAVELAKSGRNMALAGLDLLITMYQRHGLEAGYDFEYNSQYHTHFAYLSYNVRF
jgi:outer membrane autotransporter protein